MGTDGGPAVVVLAELALFWAATLLHLLRLLSSDHLPDADRLEDAGHMAMGAGMTAMVFPAVPVGVREVSAAVFAVLAVGYVARAAYRRGSTRPLVQNAVIGVGQAATAYLLAVPAHQPGWLPSTLCVLLTACALVHGSRLADTRHRPTGSEASPVLVTLPHVGTLVTTAAMAWMVAAA